MDRIIKFRGKRLDCGLWVILRKDLGYWAEGCSIQVNLFGGM